ncbi:MAG TPA: hypothetical protein VNF47_09370 [Streptosporangiaceae bacterium]|nr:hypothetical protein [Streptosporangiaceae bacterium]
MTSQLKDQRLADLAEHHNVAQFVSFSAGPDPAVRFSRIRGHDPDVEFVGVREAIDALIGSSHSDSVNIRSFQPDKQKGNPFIYGLFDAEQVVTQVRSLASQGYFCIVNETIDTHDGGVSGVVVGGVIEFTPFDTPRGVEQPGVASLPYDTGIKLLGTVYGFQPDLRTEPDERIEFSLHPLRVGYRHSHTLLWEAERVERQELQATIYWPNRFSRLIGDKAYGLLLADTLGFAVPATTVFPRAVAPFTFGRRTGTAEVWMRTSPPEPRPGHFPTTFGWSDPYTIMAKHDPSQAEIASILSQESVEPAYSGASISRDDELPDYVEGVAGRGDDFMTGQRRGESIPALIKTDVQMLLARVRELLGATHAEFVHDGEQPWIVQLHQQRASHPVGVMSPGEPAMGWLDFDPKTGLKALEALIGQAQALRKGIRVTAPVGLTSHVGDLLRRSGTPARIDVKVGSLTG